MSVALPLAKLREVFGAKLLSAGWTDNGEVRCRIQSEHGNYVAILPADIDAARELVTRDVVHVLGTVPRTKRAETSPVAIETTTVP